MALPAPPPGQVRMTHTGQPGVEVYATLDAFRLVHWAAGWRSELDDPFFAGSPAARPRDVDLSLAAETASIDQTAARTLEARWLAFIRSAGSGSPGHASWQYLGGDVTDAFVIPTLDDVLWIGADWFDGTTVNASDLFVGEALPIRNGAVQETTPGTFAVQFHMTGNTGVWLDAVSQGGQASGRIWWPLCILNDGGTMRVGCLLVGPADAENPFGVIEAGHIVTLNGLGGFGSLSAIPFAGFEVDGWIRDTTHTYIFAEPTQSLDPLGDKVTKVARVTNGQLLTYANWEFWNGTTWVTTWADAVPISDTSGATIVGDGDTAKIADGHYLHVNRFPIDEPHLEVYTATAPQGPWSLASRVVLPGGIGHRIGGGMHISQIPRILDPAVLVVAAERPPAEHSVVMLSRNLLDPTDQWTQRNIRRYCPQFVVVPNH